MHPLRRAIPARQTLFGYIVHWCSEGGAKLVAVVWRTRSDGVEQVWRHTALLDQLRLVDAGTVDGLVLAARQPRPPRDGACGTQEFLVRSASPLPARTRRPSQSTS